MQAHFPPFTKPTDAYDSARLYRETSEIAAAQDAKLDGKPRDDLQSIMAYLRSDLHRAYENAKCRIDAMQRRACVRELTREALARGEHDDTHDSRTTAPNAAPDIDWNACFPTRAQLDAAATGKPPMGPSRIATPAELAYLASFGPNARDDASALFGTLRDIPDSFTDSHGCRITRRHPMHAEALRVADERSPEDLP